MDIDVQESVFQIVRLIPKGRVTSYGAIAQCIGTKQSSRYVGWVLAHSHGVLPAVPAHRVVNRIGLLTGKHHFDTPTLMQELLEAEGIRVAGDRVSEFAVLFWNPMQEINYENNL
jgi:methylated-DNA-protein-cysteine methyltransferase-like protein